MLQQRAAEEVDARHALRPSLFGRLFRDRRWWAGRAVEVVALGCQTVALARGSLLAVQPVLATGLLMALPLHAVVSGRRIGRSDLLGATVVVAGLATFLLAGRPREGAPGVESALRWLVGFAVVGGAAAVLVAVGRRVAGRGARAALWAAAGAAVYALSGGLLKGATEVWQGRGVVACLTDPRLYGFLVVGALGTLIVQSAFQAAPLPSSIASLTATEPLAAAVVGAVVFGERLQGGAVAHGIAALGAVAMGLGTVVVAHSPLLNEDAAKDAGEGVAAPSSDPAVPPSGPDRAVTGSGRGSP